MTQHEMIVRYIRANGSVTSLEAAKKMNITKLTTRVSEMENDKGIEFVRVREEDEDGWHFRYSLAVTERNTKALKKWGYIDGKEENVSA